MHDRARCTGPRRAAAARRRPRGPAFVPIRRIERMPRAAMTAFFIGLVTGTLVDAASAAANESFFVWHITDVHVDPWYTVGSDAKSCYCETTAACQVTGPHCNMTPGVPTAADKWGNSEGNWCAPLPRSHCRRGAGCCAVPPGLQALLPAAFAALVALTGPHSPAIAAARCRSATPLDLYDSGVKFMGKHQPNAQVYFTGDFAEAGASSPCHGSAAATAQQQILDVIHYDWKTLKAAMPSGTKVFGSLGNHDSVPGDVYYGANDDGKGQQSWEYNNLTELWADDVGSASDPSIAQTIRRGGYYASRTAATGLTVVSLNINYWVVQNPEAAKPGSSAAAEGARMMSWLGTVLAAAEAKVRLPLVSWRPTHRRVRDCNSLFLSVSTFFACLLPARGMRSTSSATSHQPTEPGYLGTGTSSHGCAASTAPRSRGSFSVTFTSTSGPSLVRTAGSPRLLSRCRSPCVMH